MKVVLDGELDGIEARGLGDRDARVAASLLYVLPRGSQLLVLVRVRVSVRVRAKVRVTDRRKQQMLFSNFCTG